MQLFLHGGDFGVTDPQFGKDLGFYAFDLPFYRLVLSYLFVAVFLAFLANLISHYVFGGIRLAGRSGVLSRPARIQLAASDRDAGAAQGGCLLVRPLRTAQPHPRGPTVHRCRLYRYQRGTTGQADPMAIALICAAAAFSRARAARTCAFRAIGGAAAAELADRRCGLAVGRRADQRQTECGAEGTATYISRSIAATRQAYGLTTTT